MIVQDLYRVIPDIEKVKIRSKNGVALWCGKNEDMPIEYFERVINAIYLSIGPYEAYIVIEIA
jgi:hypothetical protein